MTSNEYRRWDENEAEWLCKGCSDVTFEVPNLKWGETQGSHEILRKVKIYEGIVTWQRNVFDTPKGKAGKEFITEITQTLNVSVLTMNCLLHSYKEPLHGLTLESSMRGQDFTQQVYLEGICLLQTLSFSFLS